MWYISTCQQPHCLAPPHDSPAADVRIHLADAPPPRGVRAVAPGAVTAPAAVLPMDAATDAVLPPLTPIGASVSLRDQAYVALKQMITDADIYARRDEIRLDERQLSAALGVSRTPIREAMTLLEQEGFLRTEPRRGIFIVRKTKKQIIEMIEMWAALESMAARLATVNASDADIAALRQMFDEFRTTTPAEHIEEYSDANIAFHQAIIRLSGSHLMGKTIDNLFIHVRAIRKMTISQSDRAARSIEDHMRIIEALERRDTELAERLVRQHSLDLAEYVDKYCDFLD